MCYLEIEVICTCYHRDSTVFDLSIKKHRSITSCGIKCRDKYFTLLLATSTGKGLDLEVPYFSRYHFKEFFTSSFVVCGLQLGTGLLLKKSLSHCPSCWPKLHTFVNLLWHAGLQPFSYILAMYMKSMMALVHSQDWTSSGSRKSIEWSLPSFLCILVSIIWMRLICIKRFEFYSC